MKLFAVFVFCLAAAHASPGIRLLEPAEVQAQADLVLEGTVVSHETKTEGRTRTDVVVVEVLKTEGKKADAVAVGKRLVFTTQCELPDPTRPIDARMAGYPNGECGAWAGLPEELTAAQGAKVRVPLTTDGKVFTTVGKTQPAMRAATGQFAP